MGDPEKPSPNLPWVEKYRPNALDELISHEDIITTIRTFIKNDKLPHLLFYGPPGTGKTSTILACAKEMYPAKLFNSMVLELNASDDRGIGIVRGQILNFASTRTIFNRYLLLSLILSGRVILRLLLPSSYIKCAQANLYPFTKLFIL